MDPSADWGKAPPVQLMRRVFREMEKVQEARGKLVVGERGNSCLNSVIRPVDALVTELATTF